MNTKWWIFLAACFSFFAMLLGRVLDVQLLRGADFRLQADDNRFFTLPMAADRGVLNDRYGAPLVWNTRKYYQVVNPEKIHFSKLPVTRDQALSLMATDSGSVVTSLERLYRFPISLSHALGFVGAVTSENLQNDKSLSVSERLGKLGLELSQNRLLRGADGKAEFEIDALGRLQKKVSESPAQAGETLTTTIDPYLSEVAQRALGNRKGAVVILDGNNGEVLSLVSAPAYESNILTKTLSDPQAEATRQEQVKQLFADERQVFFNRAINGLYPPGSVFKIVTALAGLESGKMNAETTVLDEGVLKVGEYEYGNWYYRQYGRTEGEVGIVKALARSNDIYFYKAAEWMGPDALATMARMMGFGAATPLELRPQAEGLVPTPAWKEERLNEKWYLGNTYHFGIGQGDLLVSPLQVAQMTQAVANRGSLCPPGILAGKSRQCSGLSIREENLDLVVKGMLDACSNGGTAYPFFPYNATKRLPGATVAEDLARGAMACKTGTAEFGAADEKDRRRTHGWFVAMVKIDPASLPLAAESQPERIAPTDEIVTSETDLTQLRQWWLAAQKSKALPSSLVFVSLVESDDEQPFREGSRDASPVVKHIIDWMLGDVEAWQETVTGEGE